MKHLIIYIICIGLLLTGCTIETSENDDLDGFWHLEQIDTLASQNTVDYGGQRVFGVFRQDYCSCPIR